MNAYQIIDRLASLDERATVAEPQVDPDVLPAEPPARPSEPGPDPGRNPRRDPFTLPPDFDPGTMPRPKAEDEGGDDMAAIQGWLEATQQPVQDWEWDGNELRLLMDDGSTEVYTRDQLDQTGVFSNEPEMMAMAESNYLNDEEIAALGDDDGGGAEAEAGSPFGPPAEDVVVDGPPEDIEQFAAEAPSDEAAGVLDQILGRTSSCGCGDEGGAAPSGEEGGETIHIEGEEAEELANAVSDVVNAIMGIVQKGTGGEASDSASDEKKSDEEKPDKPKKGKKKGDAKKDDKKEDKDEKKDDDE